MANPVNYVIEYQYLPIPVGMTWDALIAQMDWQEHVYDAFGNYQLLPKILKMSILPASSDYTVAARHFSIAGQEPSEVADSNWCDNFFWYHASSLPAGSLPNGVESVCIYDSHDGGQVGNIVHVTAKMKPDWAPPSESLNNMRLVFDIDGDACEIASGNCIQQCSLDYYGLGDESGWDGWNGYIEFKGSYCVYDGANISLILRHNNISSGSTVLGYKYPVMLTQQTAVYHQELNIFNYDPFTSESSGSIYNAPCDGCNVTALSVVVRKKGTFNIEPDNPMYSTETTTSSIQNQWTGIPSSFFNQPVALPAYMPIELDEYDSNGTYVGDEEFRNIEVLIHPVGSNWIPCPIFEGCADDGNLSVANGDPWDSPYPGSPAMNYDPLVDNQATGVIMNGNVYYPCEYIGCMDPEALNYNSAALDDGGCLYPPHNIKIRLVLEENSNLKVSAVGPNSGFNSSGTTFTIPSTSSSSSAGFTANINYYSTLGTPLNMPHFVIEPVSSDFTVSRLNLSVEVGVSAQNEEMLNNGGTSGSCTNGYWAGARHQFGTGGQCNKASIWLNAKWDFNDINGNLVQQYTTAIENLTSPFNPSVPPSWIANPRIKLVDTMETVPCTIYTCDCDDDDNNPGCDTPDIIENLNNPINSVYNPFNWAGNTVEVYPNQVSGYMNGLNKFKPLDNPNVSELVLKVYGKAMQVTDEDFVEFTSDLEIDIY